MKRLRITRSGSLVRSRRVRHLAAGMAVLVSLAVYAVPGASATHQAPPGGSDAQRQGASADPTTIAFRKSPPAIFSCMTGVIDNTGTPGPSSATIRPGFLGTVTATVNLRRAVPNSLYLIELVQTNGIACLKLNFTFVTTNGQGNATTTVNDFRVTNRAFVFASGGGDLEITPAVSSVS
jgi:hypothetical protein